METKKDIRTSVLKMRAEMPKKEVCLKSRKIRDYLIDSKEYKTARTLYAYMDFKNEVMTKEIIQDALQKGKKVAIPRVNGDAMDFYWILGFEELVAGTYGILEPGSRAPKATETEGLAIVPGVAFDKTGVRLGYGKGYYDRYFVNYPDFNKVALSFEMQIRENLPKDNHDLPMKSIITENGWKYLI